MRRYYDSYIEFSIYTAPHSDEYSMRFDLSWSFADMVDYICNQYAIDRDSIIEERQTFVKRFKISKND